MRGARGAMLTVLVVLAAALAWAQEPLAVVTEIQVKHGKVEIKPAGAGEWEVPKPLQSLRRGDQVRVAGEGRVVLVFTGGRGTQLVTPGNSPFTVEAKAGDEPREPLRGRHSSSSLAMTSRWIWLVPS